MKTKAKYTRNELVAGISPNEFMCALCRTTQSCIEEFQHTENCPLADDTVVAVTVSVSPEPNETICARCSKDAKECPRFNSWSLCTHARLIDICERYRAATTCHRCRKTPSECSMSSWDGFTKSHAELMNECNWYADKVGRQ